MKYILQSLYFGVCVIMAACVNSGPEKTDPNLTEQQRTAVAYVRTHLNRGESMESYSVAELPEPACLIEQPFLNLRNDVNKAGIDWQSCKTRGIESGMVANDKKIEECCQQILDLDKELQNKIGEKNSIIVMARIKTGQSRDGEPRGLVVVFDPKTMEPTDWIVVTTPVQNSVAMVINAKEGTLDEYAKDRNHDFKAMAQKEKNPVLKFVLESKAI
ncbi:MAG: hypothetical protein J1E78_00520 [Muribaculaceae bacterium]|nr:hypothetical protein [Muribaculaceae bacterium]